MDTRTLTLFLSLSDTLHFGRTSEECHISASALSRNIKHLEESLGTRLFERDNRRVELTATGRKLQAYARETLRNWSTFRESLSDDLQELTGELSIYCSVTASYSFLYHILSDFRQHYPRIELKLHTGDPAQGINRVTFGQEDMAIVIRPRHIPGKLTFRRIAISRLVLISPREPSGTLPNPRPKSREEWAETPMIMSEEGIGRERVNDWLKRMQVQPRIYAQVAGHEAIVSMVALGFGIGAVPEIVLDNSPLAERVQRLDIDSDLGTIDVGLCALKSRLKSSVMKAFWGD